MEQKATTLPEEIALRVAAGDGDKAQRGATPAPMPARAPYLRQHIRTHLGELFLVIAARLVGKPTGYDGQDLFTLRRIAYDAQHVAAEFVDPYDGQEYQIIILPKWQAWALR